MMVHRHECVSCSAGVDLLSRDGDLACGECGSDMEFAGTVGCVGRVSDNEVPADALRELVVKWRERATHIDDFGCRSVKQNCADELADRVAERLNNMD